MFFREGDVIERFEVEFSRRSPCPHRLRIGFFAKWRFGMGHVGDRHQYCPEIRFDLFQLRFDSRCREFQSLSFFDEGFLGIRGFFLWNCLGNFVLSLPVFIDGDNQLTAKFTQFEQSIEVGCDVPVLAVSANGIQIVTYKLQIEHHASKRLNKVSSKVQFR